MANRLETQSCFIWLREDGIIQTTNKTTRQQTLEDAQENVVAIASLVNGTKRPLFVDSSTPAPMTEECQKHYVSDAAAANVSAVAHVTNSWFGRFVGNLVLGLANRRRDVPVRLFDDEAEAVAWLRQLM